MEGIFVCIVQPKVIEFNVSDQKLHRAQKDEELRSELESLRLPSMDSNNNIQTDAAALLSQPGGGCRVLSQSPLLSVASVGSAVCIFEGALSNSANLAEDYAPLPEDEPTPSPTAMSSAQLVCHLYAKMGVELLGMLRGSFTFVLYESKTSRVLAARDGGGRGHLFQARSTKGSLVLSNSSELLESNGCTDKLEFLPGDYKYGWSATPRRYQPADHVRLSRRSLDLPAGAHHNHNHHNHHIQPSGSPGPSGNCRNGSRHTSLEIPPANAGADAATATVTGANVSALSAAFASIAAGAAGRHTNRHHLQTQQQQHQQPHACGTGSLPHPQFQQSGSHPHRTYVVSVEDPRIVKAPPARHHHQQQQQQQQSGTAVAGTGATPHPAAPAGTWKASAPAPGGKPRDSEKDRDKVEDHEGGGNGRGGSARGASSGHHNGRRSMDNHGAWRLGSGQGVSAAGRQPTSNGKEPTAERKEPQPQSQPLPASGAVSAGKPQQQQQQPSGTPNGGMATPGGNGRRSMEGRTPGKQKQVVAPLSAQAAKSPASQGPAVRAAVVGSGTTVGAGATTLRVEAPEFVCTRAVLVAAAPVAPAAVAAP